MILLQKFYLFEKQDGAAVRLGIMPLGVRQCFELIHLQSSHDCLNNTGVASAGDLPVPDKLGEVTSVF